MKKLEYTVECFMVKGQKGIIEVWIGNQILTRVGNNTESGINIRSGKKVALGMSAEMLRKMADQMEEEARNG